MVTSTAASKRNFSAIEFIDSQLRNCLDPKNVNELTFFKIKLATFYDYVHDMFDIRDSSGSIYFQQALDHRAEASHVFT